MSFRAHFLKTLVDDHGNVLPGCVVRVLDPGASTLVTDTLWTDNNTITSQLTNPFVTTSGVVTFYLDTPRRVRLSVTPPGGNAVFFEDLDVILQPQALTTVTDGTTPVSGETKVKFVGQNGIVVTTDDDIANAQARVIIDGSNVVSNYNVVQANGTVLPQQPNLDFGSRLTAVDDPANNRTVIDTVFRSTNGPGLPPLTPRTVNDLHFNTLDNDEYVLTGVVGASATDDFTGPAADISTTTVGGNAWASTSGNLAIDGSGLLHNVFPDNSLEQSSTFTLAGSDTADVAVSAVVQFPDVSVAHAAANIALRGAHYKATIASYDGTHMQMTLLVNGVAVTTSTATFYNSITTTAAATVDPVPVNTDKKLTLTIVGSTISLGFDGVTYITYVDGAVYTASNSVRLGLRTGAIVDSFTYTFVGTLAWHKTFAPTAAEVSFVPTGAIASTDVQDALAELDTEKSPVGHTHPDTDYYQSVVDPAGTLESQRSKIKFTNSGEVVITVTDDAGNDQTIVNVNSPAIPTDTDYYQTVVDPAGTVESQRSKIKFTNSGNVVVTITDDAGNNQTVVDIGDDHGLVTKTTNYTMATTDRIVLANGTITITLPTSPTVGQRFTIKNIGTGAVTVTPPSGTLDGAANFTMNVQYSSLDVVDDGTNWFII